MTTLPQGSVIPNFDHDAVMEVCRSLERRYALNYKSGWTVFTYPAEWEECEAGKGEVLARDLTDDEVVRWLQ